MALAWSAGWLSPTPRHPYAHGRSPWRAGWRATRHLPEATQLLEEDLELDRQLGDMPGLTDALDSLGDTAYFSGDHERAWALHAENLSAPRPGRPPGRGDVAQQPRLGRAGWATTSA